MEQKRIIPAEYRIWIDAGKRHRLSDLHIQMARELGMNPRKFGKLDNHRQELWKAPLPDFIERCYEKRFKRTRPEVVKSIEQVWKDHEIKKEERQQRKAARRLLRPCPD